MISSKKDTWKLARVPVLVGMYYLLGGCEARSMQPQIAPESLSVQSMN